MSYMPRPEEFGTPVHVEVRDARPDPAAPLRAVASRAPSPPPSPLVIGLTGPGGTGKSTVARALCEVLGHRGVTADILHTGGPLKAALYALYASIPDMTPDMINRRLDGDLKRKPCHILGGKTPTQAMQTLGTEWGRQMIDPDLWVNLWGYRAKASLGLGCAVINDSVRFENEAAAIRRLGGVVVALTGRAGDLAADHASEAGIPADLSVANTGTPQETARAILDAMDARKIAAAGAGGCGVFSLMGALFSRRADRARW